MRFKAISVLLAVFVAAAPVKAGAEDASDTASPFAQYQLVLLVRPDEVPEVTDERAQALQTEHRAHLRRMEESGKMMVAGPFSDQADPQLRGMCIYRVGSVDEARRLAESDPAVKAGHLRVQLMTWWIFADRVSFPKAPVAVED